MGPRRTCTGTQVPCKRERMQDVRQPHAWLDPWRMRQLSMGMCGSKEHTQEW